MKEILFWLYLANSLTLIVHEIDWPSGKNGNCSIYQAEKRDFCWCICHCSSRCFLAWYWSSAACSVV